MYSSLLQKNLRQVCPGALVFIEFSIDCVKADPLIKAAVSRVENSELLLVPVGDRLTYRDSKNPYKTDPKIKLKKVPTLTEWNHEGPVKSLIENECYDKRKLQDFLK